MANETNGDKRLRRRARLLLAWRENQIGKEVYADYSEDIAKFNLTTLKQLSWIGMVAGIVLVIAALPPLGILRMLNGYLLLTLLFAVLVCLTSFTLKKRPAMVLPVFYCFLLLLLGLSILMGTVWGKGSNAITFVMLTVVLPLFIIDKPWRLNLLFGLMCAAFCVIDHFCKDGELLSLDISNCIVFYLISIIISRQSISTRLSDIIIKKDLKRQRDIDLLTQLSNRGAFERRVERYIHESNQGALMLLMDLDNFKAVNDMMGHEYGDLVLKLVGEYMQAAFRKGDIVSRLGGDEFVAFLPAAGEIDTIAKKVEALIERIKSIKGELHLPCDISASVGIARYPLDGCSFQELYRRADKALYQVKGSHKGTYAVYEPEDAEEGQ